MGTPSRAGVTLARHTNEDEPWHDPDTQKRMAQEEGKVSQKTQLLRPFSSHWDDDGTITENADLKDKVGARKTKTCTA